MDKKTVYVYALQGLPETIRQQAAAHLGQPLYHWVADTADLHLGEGVPDDWREQGAIFSDRGELRWRCRNDLSPAPSPARGGELVYQAVLLTEAPVSGLEPLPGNWQGEERDLFLQHLGERRLKPAFLTYPGGGASGRFRAWVYYRDGVATFVSPRELIPEAGGA